MSTVDTRIVVLQFDNQDFEKNVSTSIDSITKLKKETNFEETGKGLEKLNANVKTFDTENMVTALDRVKDRFSIMGIAGTEVIRNLTNEAVNFGKKIITAIPNQIRTGGFTRAQNIEQAKFQLEGLKVAWDDIQADINYGVQDTAYGLDSAAKAASQLVASGIEFGETFGDTGNSPMAKALRGISGVAAMTNSSYDDISRIFTTVAGNGRLMGDQLRQLASRGLNVAATLATALGTTEEEIRELVTKGEIDFHTFSEAMDEAFGDQATAANKTYAGSLSNVKAALNRLGATYYTDHLKIMRNLFNSFIPLINAAHSALKPLITVVAGVFKWISEKTIGRVLDFSAALNTFQERSEALTKTLREKFGLDDLDTNLEKISAKVLGLKTTTDPKQWEKVKTAVETIGHAGQITADDLAKMGEDGRTAASILSESFNIPIKDLRQMAVDGNLTIEGLIKTFKKVGDESEESKKDVQAFSDSVDEMARRVIKGEFGNGQVRYDALEELGYNWKIVQNRVNELMDCEYRHQVSMEEEAEMAKRLGFVTKEVAESTEELSENTEGASKIAKQGASIWSDLKDIFGGLVSFGKGVVKGVIAVGKGVLPLLKEIAGFLLDVVKIITNGLAWIGRWITGAEEAATATDKWGSVTETVTNVLQPLVNAVKAGREGLANFVVKVKELGEKLRNMPGVQKFMTQLKELKTSFSELGGKIGERLGKFFGNTEDGLNKTRKFLPSLENLADFIDFIAGKLADFIEFSRNAGASAREFFSGFGGKVAEGFKAFIQFIVDRKDSFIEFLKSITDNGLVQGLIDFKDKIVKGIGELLNSEAANGNLPSIGDRIKEFVAKISEAAKNVNWKQLIAFAVTMGSIISSILRWITIRRYMKSLTAVNNSVSGFFDAISNKIKGKLPKRRVFLEIAISLGILAGSLFLISQIPADDLKRSAAVMAGAFVMLLGGVLVLQKIDKAGLSAKTADAFVKMAGSILILAFAAKIFATMSGEDLLKAGITIVTFMGYMALASAIAGSSKAGGTFLGMSVALLILIPSILFFSKIAWETVLRGGLVVFLLMSELALAARIANGVKGGAAAMIALAFSVLLLTPAILIIGNMKLGKAIQGALVIGGVMMAMGFAARIATKYKGASKNLTAMVAPIVATAFALSILAALPLMNVAGSAVAMALAILGVAASFRVLKSMKSDVMKKRAEVMIAVIASLALAFSIMAAMGVDERMLAVAAGMGAVLLATAYSLRILSDGKVDAKKALPQAGVMALLMVAVGGVFVGLSKLDVNENLLATATGMSEVLIATAAAIKIMGDTSLRTAAEAAAGVLAAMAIIFGGGSLLFGIIGGLTSIGDTKANIELGAEVIGILGQGIGNFLGGIINGVVEGYMTAITDTLPAMGESINTFWENIQDFVTGVSETPTSFADNVGALVGGIGALIGEGFLKKVTDFFSGGGDNLASLGISLNEFAKHFVPFVEKMAEIPPASVNATARAISAVAELLNALPTEGGLFSELTGTKSLVTFGEQLADFGPKFHTYYTNVKDITESSLAGSSAAAKTIAEFANLVPASGGLLQEIMGGKRIDEFGVQLATFGLYFHTYYTNVKDITEKSLAGSSAAAETIMKFADLVPASGGLLQEIMGGKRIDEFGVQLATFGLYFHTYYTNVKDITEESLAGSSAAAETIMKFADLVPKQGGLFQDIVGGQDLSVFGLQLARFGFYFQHYYNNVKGITEESLSGSSAAVGTIMEFANAVPKEGGLLDKIFNGTNNLETFGAELKAFGGYFKDYSSDMTGVDTDIVNKSTAAAASVLEFATALKEADLGGAWYEQGVLVEFGADLYDFGTQLVNYSDKMKKVEFDIVESSVSVVGTLMDITRAISIAASTENSGDIFKNLQNLGGDFKQFGVNLKEYSDSLKDVNLDDISISVTAIQTIANVALAITENPIDEKAVTRFGTSIQSLGPNMQEFGASMSAIDWAIIATAVHYTEKVAELVKLVSSAPNPASFGTNINDLGIKIKIFSSTTGSLNHGKIQQTVNTVYKLIDMLNAMRSVNASSASGFTNAMQTLGKNGINSFITAFNNGEPRARAVIYNFIASLGRSVNSSSLSTQFYYAGVNGAQGLINGLNVKATAVYNTGVAIGKKAVQGAKAGMAERSPSKEMYKIGVYGDEGLINGLLSLSNKVYSTGEGIGESVIDAVSSPMQKVLDLLNSDPDFTPVITPVLDLTNIQNGSAQIGNMLQTGYSFGGGTGFMMAGLNASYMNASMQTPTMADQIAQSVGSIMDQALSDIQKANDNTQYTIEVPVIMNGREVAHVTAPYMRGEISTLDRNAMRKAGIK